MPQSLADVLLHVVFSTKDRAPSISLEASPALHAYLATVVRDQGCDCLAAGGHRDHVHLAVRLSRTLTIAKLVEEAKTSSSRWMKTKGARDFAWQRGYGAFSVSRGDLADLRGYVARQEEHHRRTSFQEEYRAILLEHGLDFDERYLWD